MCKYLGTTRFRASKISLLILYILINLILAACSSEITPQPTATPTVFITPTFGNTSSALAQDWQYRWLKGIPCSPPCWEGVTPGITQSNDAYNIWKQSPILTNLQIGASKLFPNEGYVIWSWTGSNVDKENGEAHFKVDSNDKIIYTIHPYYNTSFKLEDVIKAYGEPSHVYASASPNPEPGSGMSYYIKLVYLAKGFDLSMGVISKPDSGKPALSLNSKFNDIDFFATGLTGFVKFYPGISNKPDLLVPWQGFKDFDYYCRDSSGSGKEDCSKILKPAP
jgi:hypothetical protein